LEGAVVALAAAVVGAAVAVVDLLELLREHAPATTQTASRPTKTFVRVTESPRSRKADDRSP